MVINSSRTKVTVNHSIFSHLQWQNVERNNDMKTMMHETRELYERRTTLNIHSYILQSHMTGSGDTVHPLAWCCAMHQRRGFLRGSMPDLITTAYLASKIGSVSHGSNQLCRGIGNYTRNVENIILIRIHNRYIALNTCCTSMVTVRMASGCCVQNLRRIAPSQRCCSGSKMKAQNVVWP